MEKQTSRKTATTYNNFYELGDGKRGPKENAHKFITDPWSVEIAGECNEPGVYSLEDILKGQSIEERIYRLTLCRSLVDGDPLAGFQPGRLAHAVQTQLTRKICFV